jgi:hypothetical protein
MNGARKAYRGLVFLILGLIAVQFFLAGLGVFGDQGKTGSDFDPHRALGNVLLLLSLILLILAAVGRLGRPLVPMTAGLFVLMFIQGILAGVGEDTQVVGALHVLNALVLVGLVFHLFQAVRDGVPEPAAASAAGPPSTV